MLARANPLFDLAFAMICLIKASHCLSLSPGRPGLIGEWRASTEIFQAIGARDSSKRDAVTCENPSLGTLRRMWFVNVRHIDASTISCSVNIVVMVNIRFWIGQ